MHAAVDFSSYKNVISFINDYSAINPEGFAISKKRIHKM